MSQTTRRGKLEAEIADRRRIFKADLANLIFMLSEVAGKRDPETFDFSTTDAVLDKMEESAGEIMDLRQKLQDVMTDPARLKSLSRPMGGR